METQTVKKNEEFHDLLDNLEERKLFGEVTMYFQGGAIESCRVSERHTKNELKAKKASRPKVLVLCKDKSNVNG